MKKIAAFCVLFIISNKSICQTNNSESTNQLPEWVSVAVDTKGDTTFIKSEYVSKDNSGIKVWTKKNYTKNLINGTTYKNSTSKVLYIFDCNNQKLKLIKVVDYDSEGNIIENADIADYNQTWTEVVPDTIGESLIKKACSLFNN